MSAKRVLLLNREGQRIWLEQRSDGAFYDNEEEIFASESEANEKGWKIDAVKVVFDSKDAGTPKRIVLLA